MTATESKIVSPCVSLCCLDEEDFCMGCLRHVSEITGWQAMSDEQKRALIVELSERRESTEIKGNKLL